MGNVIYELFPGNLQKEMVCLEQKLSDVQEIRVRVDRPLMVLMNGKEHFISRNGQVVNCREEGRLITQRELEEILLHICHSSLYAYEEEIKKGYITIRGGHRVGLAGQAVLTEGEALRTIKNISFLNIRIAHEIKGVSDRLLPYVYENGKIVNTLIISPPGYGKTTLLRDLIRNISDGNPYDEGRSCCIVDERSELAGCFNGIPQLDVGMRTDVMDACPKSMGMMMVIRSMAPRVVAVDELGTMEDMKSLFSVIRSGCSILATIHGDNLQSLQEKSFLKEVMDEKVFNRYIVIKNNRHEMEVFNGDLKKC